MTEHVKSFYPPRPGMAEQISIEAVSEKLSPELIQEVLEWEHTLTLSENLTPEEREETPGIESIWRIKSKSATFWPEYFLTQEGREILMSVLKIDELPSCFDSQIINNYDSASRKSVMDQISQFIALQDFSSIDTTLIDTLEGNCRKFVEDRIVKSFAESDFSSVEQIELPERFSVYLNPDEVVSKLTNYRKLKNYYRKTALELKKENTPLSKAKYSLLQIHRRKLNELIAGSYSTALNLVSHGDLVMRGPSTQEQRARWKNFSKHAMEFVEGPLTFTHANTRARNFSRMDKLRHGAGISWRTLVPQVKQHFGVEIDLTLVNPDDLTPISQEFLDLIIKGKLTTVTNSEFRYRSVESIKIDEAMIDANNLIELFELALDRQNLKSTYTDYNSQRSGRSPDNLWQVVSNLKKNSISVNGKQGVIKVGATYYKNILEAIPILAHEGVHVMQNEIQKNLITLALAKEIGVKSTDIMEAGAKTAEDKVRQNLFGLSIDTHNTDYLMAQITKMAGGSFLECVKAWFDSHCLRFPNKDKEVVARDAFDRTLRIFRSGGSISESNPHPTNTKDFVYTEQNLIVKQLEKQGLEFLIYIGLDSETYRSLESGGFVNRQDIRIPEKNFLDLIMDKIDELVGFSETA